MEENIHKRCNKQAISFQNLQTVHVTQSKIQITQQKMGRRPNIHFSKDDIQIAKKPTKRCSTLLILREMHIKTIHTYNKIAAHSNQNVHPQSLQTIMLERVWRKENPPTLLVEM